MTKTPDRDLTVQSNQSRLQGRRGLLIGLAAGGMGLLAPRDVSVAAPVPSDDARPAVDPKQLTVPFYGPHQAGITTPQPFAGLIAAFDVLSENREQLQQLFADLTTQIRFLTQGGRPPEEDEGFPPDDNGLLGPEVKPERLTITLAIGASLFDDRFGLTPLKPKSLAQMEAFPNDALDEDLCHGDICLQFCAETPEEIIHALRSIIKANPDQLAIKWKQDGFTATHGIRRGQFGTGRNMLGFKDGTANPKPTDEAAMNDFVWVQPGSEEPAWTIGGSYQVIRIIGNTVEAWDRTSLGEQEGIIGRKKDTGAPLGKANEFDDPEYSSDPDGKRIPLDAHIRLANPRTAATPARLIRRGFNYSNGLTKAGQLQMGLLFIAFQSDLERGFLAIQNRLNGEPLEEYIKPFGGGYFFALPGIPSPGGVLGENLFAAARSFPQSPSEAPNPTSSKKG